MTSWVHYVINIKVLEYQAWAESLKYNCYFSWTDWLLAPHYGSGKRRRKASKSLCRFLRSISPATLRLTGKFVDGSKPSDYLT